MDPDGYSGGGGHCRCGELVWIQGEKCGCDGPRWIQGETLADAVTSDKSRGHCTVKGLVGHTAVIVPTGRTGGGAHRRSKSPGTGGVTSSLLPVGSSPD